MAVRIRMKRLGRKHRPFFRVCAMDARTPRDGRDLEELGHYDPLVNDVDARAVLNRERIDYWLSVGAQPSEKVKVLIKKYGTDGTHLDRQRAALERLGERRTFVPAVLAAPTETQKEQPEAGQEDASEENVSEATPE